MQFESIYSSRIVSHENFRFRLICFLDIYVQAEGLLPKSGFNFVKVGGLICYYSKGRKVKLFILNSSRMAKRQKEKKNKKFGW